MRSDFHPQTLWGWLFGNWVSWELGLLRTHPRAGYPPSVRRPRPTRPLAAGSARDRSPRRVVTGSRRPGVAIDLTGRGHGGCGQHKRVAAFDGWIGGHLGTKEPDGAARTWQGERCELRGEGALRRGYRIGDLRAVQRPQRPDRRYLVARHARPKQPRHRDGRHDADDRDDDQDLDQRESTNVTVYVMRRSQCLSRGAPVLERTSRRLQSWRWAYRIRIARAARAPVARKSHNSWALAA